MNTQVKAVVRANKKSTIIGFSIMAGILLLVGIFTVLFDGFAIDKWGHEAIGWNPADVDWPAFIVTSTFKSIAIFLFVYGIVNATYARTYLGAGISRDAFLRANLVQSTIMAVMAAVLVAIAALGLKLLGSPLTGTMTVSADTYSNNSLFDILIIPIAGFILYWIGFAISMTFVRWIWWVGLTVVVALVALQALASWIYERADIASILPNAPADVTPLTLAAAGFLGVLAIVISYGLAGRLQMRR